jgi:FMN phosphatase YigB (HAD superfamily)
MAAELTAYYLTHIRRIGELSLLRNVRKSREAGILTAIDPVFAYWLEEKPLRYLYLFRDRKLLSFIQTLRERGAKTAVYSDYPAERKLRAFRGFTADYCFCADDALIRCLKPESSGLKTIAGVLGETAEDIAFIGDRYEKDGKCAEAAGIDYLILDGNPISRRKGYSNSIFQLD